MQRGRFANITSLRPTAFRPWSMVWLLAVLMATSGPAPAADDDLFEVLDIKVDETDETAAAAREKALQSGERRAWDTLVQRFVDPQQRRLPQFSQQEIGDAVKDFWVSGEKTSPVRYIATLNYNFKPQRVERLLASRGVRFTITRSDPLVVMPVYTADGTSKLWDDPNPWRQAWQGMRLRGLLTLKVPQGDIGDLSIVGVEQAVAGDRARLAELAQRYEAADALMTLAKVEPGSTPDSQQLKVTAIRYNLSTTQPLADRSFPIEGAGVTPELLGQAALAVANDVDVAYRRGWTPATGLVSPLDARQSTTAQVVVPVSSLDDWVAKRKRIQSLPQLDRVKLVSLSRDAARLTIVYPGPTDQLAAALVQAGLYLSKQNGEWVISSEAPRVDQQSGAAAQ
jgi:uncharacterized protein DUF2066